MNDRSIAYSNRPHEWIALHDQINQHELVISISDSFYLIDVGRYLSSVVNNTVGMNYLPSVWNYLASINWNVVPVFCVTKNGEVVTREI